MNKANRASQFAPFDALKGLQEALREKEEKHSRVEKRELSEEKQEEISNTLIQVEIGAIVKVLYYCKGKHYTLTDKLVEKNIVYKFLIIGKNKIFFSDLYEFIIV